MNHPENITVEAIPFPVPFGEMPCLVFQAKEQDVFSRFGEPHQRSKEDEVFGEPGPCAYWAFRYSCGLELVLTYYFYADCARVSANRLEVEHILEHLGIPAPNLWKMEVDGSQRLSA